MHRLCPICKDVLRAGDLLCGQKCTTAQFFFFNQSAHNEALATEATLLQQTLLQHSRKITRLTHSPRALHAT